MVEFWGLVFYVCDNSNVELRECKRGQCKASSEYLSSLGVFNFKSLDLRLIIEIFSVWKLVSHNTGSLYFWRMCSTILAIFSCLYVLMTKREF